MTVVTALPHGRPLTAADLEAMPDDGHRYELIDGALVVTPSPTPRHQRVVGRLFRLLDEAAPPDLEVFVAPLDVALADDTVLQPDVLVCRRSELGERNLPATPLLAVEVLSASTRLIDLNLKRARYEQANCASYWVVDPDHPSIVAWELREGAYVEIARVTESERFTATTPYDVEVVPATLLS